jgi:hypothetical protein
MFPGKNKKEKSEICKKIEELYHNYGIDTSNMSDEEFESVERAYSHSGKDLDADLKESEKYRDRFADEII